MGLRYGALTACWDCGRIWQTRPKYCCIPSSVKELRHPYAKSMPQPPRVANVNASQKPLQSNGARIFANIIIGCEEVSATVDTSSAKSFVSETLLQRIAGKNYHFPLKYIDGGVQLQVRLGFSSGHFRFIIAPSAFEEVVLGLDFLNQIGTTLICGGNTLKLKLAPEKNAASWVESSQHLTSPNPPTQSVTASIIPPTPPPPSISTPAPTDSAPVKEERSAVDPKDDDPLAGVDVRGYDDKTVTKLRLLVRAARATRRPGTQRRFIEVVRGKRIQINICKDGRVLLRPVQAFNAASEEIKTETAALSSTISAKKHSAKPTETPRTSRLTTQSERHSMSPKSQRMTALNPTLSSAAAEVSDDSNRTSTTKPKQAPAATTTRRRSVSPTSPKRARLANESSSMGSDSVQEVQESMSSLDASAENKEPVAKLQRMLLGASAKPWRRATKVGVVQMMRGERLFTGSLNLTAMNKLTTACRVSASPALMLNNDI